MKFGGEFLKDRRHEGVGPEPPRHLRVQHAAPGGDPRSRRSRRTLEQSVRVEYRRRCSRSCSSSTSSSTTTSSSTCRGRTTAAWFGDNWRATGNLTINLGLRYDLDWAGLDPPGVHDIPILDRTTASTTANFGYKTGDARHDRLRAARRVRLQRRREKRPGHPRRHRYLLQLPGVERHLPAAVLQQRRSTAVFLPTDTELHDGQPDRRRVTGAVSLRRGADAAAADHDHLARLSRIRMAGRARSGFQKQLGPLMAFDVDFTDLEELRSGAQPRREPLLRSDHRLQQGSDRSSDGRIRPGAWISGSPATARRRRRLHLELVHAPVQPQLPGGRDLHPDAVDEGQHDRLRLLGQQPVQPGRRLGARRRASSATRSAPTASSRCPGSSSVAGVVLLRIGRALQRDELGHGPSASRARTA